MTGQTMIIMGIVCEAIAVVVFISSVIYQKTVGKKIMEELDKDY